MKGHKCTNCGTTDKACLLRIHGGQTSCCSSCYSTDTHVGVSDDGDHECLVEENIALRSKIEQLEKTIRLIRRALSKVDA